MAKDRPFAFAGLWDRWRNGEGAPLESCTIVTTEANDLMRPLHDRMPVILPEENYAEWLRRKNENVPELEALLRPYPAIEMTASEFDRFTNRVK
jgi:putative SOS response-associated peptidase YedK